MMNSYRIMLVLVVCAVAVLGLLEIAVAQRVVSVQPDGGGVFGRLNDAIEGDTLSDGSRVDLNTIYELESGGFYLTRTTIANDWDGTLTIRAASGYTVRPVIQPLVPTGGSSSRPFSPEGNLTLQGLYVTNLDNGAGLLDRIVRIRADSVRIIVDDCHLDMTGQSAFRIDTDNVNIYVTNSIISNIGIVESISNGRVFDDRGNNIDTLYVENNTMYNVTQRILRDGGGWIKYAYFNHNTFHTTLQQFLTVGEFVNFTFKNNIVYNYVAHGQDTSSVNTVIEMEALTDSVLVAQGNVQTADIRNNNFYLDPSISALYPDSATAAPVFDSLSQVYVDQGGTAGTMIEEQLAFTAEPDLQTVQNLVTAFYGGTPLPSLDDGGGSTTNQMPFNFEYPNTTQSYSQGADGNPLGDVSWFGLVLGINDFDWSDATIPKTIVLNDNYPNPFNPETTIEYGLPQRNLVTLSIYNTLGQKIITLVEDGIQSPGTYRVRWDGRDQYGNSVSSGIYFYQLNASGTSLTKRLLLMK